MIKCIRCKEHKDESKFYKKSDSKTGYSSICKSCRKEYRRMRDGYYDKIAEKKNATEYTCIVCGVTKHLDLENFGPNKNKTNGYTTYCRECIRKKGRENSRRVRSKNREEKPKILIIEPCCCDRCGIELPEWDSTTPDTGTWYGSYLCRACHFETTSIRVRKGVRPKNTKIPIATMTVLKRIRPTTDATVRRARLPAFAPAPGP